MRLTLWWQRREPRPRPAHATQVASRCDGCARPCERPLRCSRCKLARYCCADHQRAAWGAGHKEECAALAACAPRVPPPTVRMLARALWRRARWGWCRGPPPGGRSPASSVPYQNFPMITWSLSPGMFGPSHLTREQQQAGAAAAKPGGGWADVWALVDHWDDVAPGGKVAYAQMAALARCGCRAWLRVGACVWVGASSWRPLVHTLSRSRREE